MGCLGGGGVAVGYSDAGGCSCGLFFGFLLSCVILGGGGEVGEGGVRLERPERLEGSECFFHMGFFWVGRGRWLDTPVSPKSVGLLLCGNPGVEVRFFLLVACVREGGLVMLAVDRSVFSIMLIYTLFHNTRHSLFRL